MPGLVKFIANLQQHRTVPVQWHRTNVREGLEISNTNEFARCSRLLVHIAALTVVTLALYGCAHAVTSNNQTPQAPTIAGIDPSSGTVGTSAIITGTNFGPTQGNSTITFNGTAASTTNWTATSITTTVPTGATTGNVVVTVGSLASNGVSFTVTVPAPTITSLNPNSGESGTSVTITGTNFGAMQGTSTVKFNGTTGTPTSWSATSIVVPVPSGATTGNVVVTVGGQNSNGVNFTVGSTSNISVTLSPVRGGATVTQQIQLTATVANDLGAAGVTWAVSAGGRSRARRPP